MKELRQHGTCALLNIQQLIMYSDKVSINDHLEVEGALYSLFLTAINTGPGSPVAA